MIVVNGIELDFDITSPLDVKRYRDAGERMNEEGRKINLPAVAADDPAFLNAYVEMLNCELRLFGDFLDDVFGEGVAEQLLGSNPSINKVNKVLDAFGKAIEKQGNEFGITLQKYTPNRAARRSKR